MIIFGSGEIASLARFYFENDYGMKVKAFTVDDDYADGGPFEGIPCVPFSQALRDFPPETTDIHVALSYRGLNRLRQSKFEQCHEYRRVSYISSKAIRWPDFSAGANSFVLEQNNIQPRVRLGDNNMLWSGNHIGHGTVIGNHNYFASHVVVSGNCKIGDRNFFGVNATVKDFTTIGNDCFITMDASVTKDMPDGSVAIGREIITGEKADRIKGGYFG